MSYPYGPEAYPTFEALETKGALEALRQIYYYELRRLAKDRCEKAAAGKGSFQMTDAEGGLSYGDFSLGDVPYEDEPTVEERGIAFARALEYALDVDECDLDRFFQDVFAILEDRVVSRCDSEDGEWSEDEGRLTEAAAVKALLNRGDGGEHEEAYKDDLTCRLCEHKEFVAAKILAVEERANAIIVKNGLGCELAELSE